MTDPARPVGVSSAPMRSGTWPATPIRDDRNLKVFRQADNVLRKIPAVQPLSQAGLRLRHEDLRDLIVASEFHHSLCGVPTADDSRFDLQSSSETKVLFDRVALIGW